MASRRYSTFEVVLSGGDDTLALSTANILDEKQSERVWQI